MYRQKKSMNFFHHLLHTSCAMNEIYRLESRFIVLWTLCECYCVSKEKWNSKECIWTI